MTYTYDEDIVSDLYKDATGHRPDSIWWSAWRESDEDQKQRMWNELVEILSAEIERERLREEKAMKRFEKRIEANMKLGAPTREDAIRWILQSMNLSEIDLAYGASYICYQLDLPYTMENVLKPIVKQLRAA